MKELSEHLKSERLRQGLSLKEASERARVSSNMLEALEEGDFHRIGTALLIRSFVRAYGEGLGIDPTPLLEKHSEEIRACDRQAEGLRQHGTWSKPVLQRKQLRVFTIAFFLIAASGVFYGAAWLSNRQEPSSMSQKVTTEGYPLEELPPDLPKRERPPSEPQTKTEAIVRSETGARAPAEASNRAGGTAEGTASAPKSQPSPASSPLVAAGGHAEVMAEEKPAASSQDSQKHRFTVEAEQKTWVQVRIDNKQIREALLEPGERREWEADDGMQVVVGNAGGVHMKWNGEPVNAPGRPGSVLRFRLPDPKYTKTQN